MGKAAIHQQQSLVRFRARDGFMVSSLLVTKEYTKKEEILHIPVLLQVHGLLGHFLSRGTPRLLPHALLEHGFSSLSINTRLATAGQITGKGILDDTIHDIDAAVEFLANEGFRNIFILGYSLGVIMVVYWASKREHPNVRGVILEGSHYSFPDTKRRIFEKFGSFPTYEELYEKARALLGDEPYNSPRDETFVVYQCRGPNPEPLSSEVYTYKTWWFMIGPEAHNAMTYRNIGKINIPILIIRGAGDFLVEDWEPDALARIAREAGNQNVQVRPIPGARHDCMENPGGMLEEIISMFSAHSAQ